MDAPATVEAEGVGKGLGNLIGAGRTWLVGIVGHGGMVARSGERSKNLETRRDSVWESIWESTFQLHRLKRLILLSYLIRPEFRVFSTA